jgi:hypothetical protein
LLDRPATLDAIVEQLPNYEVIRRNDAFEAWEFGGRSITIAYKPEINGLVSVDAVDQPWPDQMGDPKLEPTLFGAWGMGFFGPFTYPGSLERAGQQCWAWNLGKQIVALHRSFIRIRASYAFGASDDSPVIPVESNALEELHFVTELARALLGLDGALCYFNPNGEVLRDAAGVQESLSFARENELPPLDLWCNVRLFNAEAGWLVMDTVGNGQLDIPDVEVCCPRDACDCSEIDGFLRNVSDYLLRQGEVIQDGDTMDGPGGRWQARHAEDSICSPPRRTLRWFLQDAGRPPTSLALPKV